MSSQYICTKFQLQIMFLTLATPNRDLYHTPENHSSSYSVPKLRYRPLRLYYNIFVYMLQNHSSVTLFTLCVHECPMNIYTKFYLPTVFYI